MDEKQFDPDSTVSIDELVIEETAGKPKRLESPITNQPGAGPRGKTNDPRRILPKQIHTGSSLWRKLVALIGLGAFSVLGGLAITLLVGILAVLAAVILQAAIS